MYKVLWFDDKFETSEGDIEIAFSEGIKLIGVTNAREGIKTLLDDPAEFDAILLDGLFYENAEQTGTDVDDSAFGQVAKAISDLKAKGISLPWFIYSGQQKFRKGDSPFIKLFKDESFANGKVFDKNKDEDFPELCAEIKKAADANPLRKIKMANPEVFQIFDLGYLPEDVEKQVLRLLMDPLPTDKTELKSTLVNIRSVQESCFIKLQSIGVLPSLETFAQKMKHLSGNINARNNYRPSTFVHQNQEIENLQKWIYYTCGNYIHHLEAQHYDEYMISNYSVQSMKMGLMEVLLWFKKTYRENL